MNPSKYKHKCERCGLKYNKVIKFKGQCFCRQCLKKETTPIKSPPKQFRHIFSYFSTKLTPQALKTRISPQ